MAYRDNPKQNTTFKKSLLALSVMALSTPALAQTGDQDMVLEEIIVSGTRQNLQNAQDIRRNADTFVDAISAEDIGSLPDRSVLEAMQRMPGVSIERFQAPDDPDHFGAEGSGAVIRGMSQTRSEFNGRDSFSANSGRGLNFQDVPPELMGGVDLYKNQSADMIEGGIGGTVSLRTRKPFDQDGRLFAISGDISYGDLAEKASPTVSGLFSDRWMTDFGEFGLLVNASYSQLYAESHGIQSDAYLLYDAADLNAPDSVVTRDDGRVWMTNGSNFFTKEDDRVRQGFAAAGQWASLDGTMQATAQFLRSDARLTWKENAIKYQGGYDDQDVAVRRARPHPDAPQFAWDQNGVFQAGFITDGSGWRGASSSTPGGGIPEAEYFGFKYQADTRFKDTRTITDDLSFNFQWSPTDRWDLEADIQFVDATASDDDLQVATGLYALQNFDTTGRTPNLTVIEPWFGRRGDFEENYNPQPAPWNEELVGSDWYFQNPENYWWRSAMDHYERSEGELRAYRFDATHHLDEVDFFTSVKAGVRYADRNQVVRATSYNWGHIGAEWEPGSGGGALWMHETEELADQYEFVDWSNFHRGNVFQIAGPGPNGFLFPKESLLRDVIDGRRQLPQNNPDGDGIWEPYQNRADVIPGTYFEPSEVYDTTERNKAAYVRLDFETEMFGRRATGNFGARYVELDRTAIGSVIFPDLVPGNPPPEGAPDVRADPEEIRAWAEDQVGTYDPDQWETEQDWEDDVLRTLSYSREPFNWLTEEERNFGNDYADLVDNRGSYRDVLPSFNLRVDLSDEWIARFAVSKALAWPDMSEVRNQAVLGTQQLVVTYVTDDGEEVEEAVDPDAPVDGGRNIERVGAANFIGSGGNPDLAPMESWQFDLAAEWYFAPVGSLTMSVFYKDLKNFFIQGAFAEDYVNPSTGQTQEVLYTTTRNGGDGHLQGFEIAYQQFYDMLPAPFDGFGIQANYTYIDSEGIPNFSGSDPATEADPGEPEDPQPGMDVVNIEALTLPLRGQSRHTANFVAMYEKNDWAARLAYNWRSEYLVTTRDVISGAPIWNTSQGFLDGSVFYNVTPEIKIGLQGTNLLNTQTRTRMTLDENDTRTGRSWFVNDRRLALILQATF